MDARYMVLIGVIMFYANTLRPKGVPDKIIARSIRHLYHNPEETVSKVYDRIMQGYIRKVLDYNKKHNVDEAKALADFEACMEQAVPATLF